MTFDDQFPELPEMHDAVLVLAFEGWNDAGEAATGAIDHLLEVWDAEWLGELDPEEYYDFQVNRPEATFDEAGQRQIVFPTTRLFLLKPPANGRSLLVMRGLEPNIKWRSFTQDVLAVLRELDVRLVITLGAMLAETPHTRPIPVTCSATTDALNAKYGYEPSKYEGPTGIVGVIASACAAAEIPVVSLWAAVPHYYAQPPSPKGTLALISSLEDVLDISIPVGDLPEESHAWESDVDELAQDNEDVLGYVQQLESTHDAKTPADATSGDDIAKEFERFLRRQGNQ